MRRLSLKMAGQTQSDRVDELIRVKSGSRCLAKPGDGCGESFYDPNLHGQNLADLQAHFAAYLPNISTREDLNTLFRKCFHTCQSATFIAGGDVAVPQRVRRNSRFTRH